MAHLEDWYWINVHMIMGWTKTEALTNEHKYENDCLGISFWIVQPYDFFFNYYLASQQYKSLK